MHEFPEVQAMVRDACAQAPAEARITRLTIVIGEASGHDPHHIQEHFAEASRGTKAESASLLFVREKLSARCAECGATFSNTEFSLSCSQCGGTELVVTGGNNVRLESVQWM